MPDSLDDIANKLESVLKSTIEVMEFRTKDNMESVTVTALDGHLNAESEKLSQQLLSSLRAKYAPYISDIVALEQQAAKVSYHMVSVRDTLFEALYPERSKMYLEGASLGDLSFFKFLYDMLGRIDHTIGMSVQRILQIRNDTQRLMAVLRPTRPGIPTFGECQIADAAGTRLLSTVQAEFENTMVKFDELLRDLYLHVKGEYKRLRKQFLGKAAGPNEQDRLEEEFMQQMFGMKRQQEIPPLNPATELIDDNVMLTQFLMDLSEVIPEEHEHTVSIYKDGIATGRTKTTKIIDESHVDDAIMVFSAAKHMQYLAHANKPSGTLTVVFEALQDFHANYRELAEIIDRIMEKTSNMTVTSRKGTDFRSMSPGRIERQFLRINFLSLRPNADDVAPRNRMERDYSIARNKLLLHIQESIQKAHLMQVPDRPGVQDEIEDYLRPRVREAIELKAKVKEVTETEQQRNLKRNIQDDNEFYISKGTGRIGELTLERAAAPRIVYTDVIGASFNKAKEHVEEVVKVASHPHIMRLSAPRGDVRSNLLLIGAYGCISGDSRIDMPRDLTKHPDGIPIRELVGTRPWVYSFDQEQNKVVCNRASVVVHTGYEKVLEIKYRYLANRGLGHKWEWVYGSIKATANHEFLLRLKPDTSAKWGQLTQEPLGYKRVDEIRIGDRLLSLGRIFVEKDDKSRKRRPYAKLSLNNGEYAREHILITEAVYGTRSEEFVSHHKDDNSLNDDPGNLEWMTGSGHSSHHAKERRARGEFTGWEESGIHPRGMLGKTQTEKNKVAASLQSARTAEIRCNRRLELFGGEDGLREMYRSGMRVTQIAKKVGCTHTTVTNWLRRLAIVSEQPVHNHEVISIEEVGYEDVYDMTVPGPHNYCANGVFVHNCGKTEFAKAVGSDPRVIGANVATADMLTAYMHESVKNVKRMYDAASDLRKGSRNTKPVAILLDEFDRLFSYGEGVNAAMDGSRMEGTMQEMMDGVLGYEGVFLVAMTNVPKRVPEAILRRFKYVDVVGQLTKEERAQLLKMFLTRGLPLHSMIAEDDYLRWAEELDHAPGDVLGKIADEVHFKFMHEMADKSPKRVAGIEHALSQRLRDRPAKPADRVYLKKMLAGHREIDAAEIDIAIRTVKAQPQIQMQIKKSKEVYRDAAEIMAGLSRVDSSGLGFGSAKKSELWRRD